LEREKVHYDSGKNKFVKRAQDLKYKKEIRPKKCLVSLRNLQSMVLTKSHSTSYAMIAYQTAYLKAHYPVEFMAALLTAEAGGVSNPNKDTKVALAWKNAKDKNQNFTSKY